jgi:arylsulfatase
MKMMKVSFLSILAVVSMGIASANAERPNIVLIMADDLGWQELGSYGQEKIETPRIDQLAAEGMKFMQFYAGSAVCAPSRCNLMTGMHGGHAYIRNNGEIKTDDPERFGGQTPIPASIPTIAKTLKEVGYKTGCFGKWGLGAQGSSGDPLRQGFDHFYGYNCQRNAHNLYPKYLEDDDKLHLLEGNDRSQTGKQYAPQLIADRMLDFVRDNKDQPFFLYYPTVIPHLPLQAPDEAIARYAGRWEDAPYTGKSYQPHETPKACYAAMISFMDDQVGRLVDLLEELDLDDNTIILFTSDNGTTHLKAQVDYEFFESLGPLRGLKGQLYEGGIRVPLVARWPGKIKAGTVSNHLAAHYDIPATLADAAGTSFAPDTDGISFLPMLTGDRSGQEKHKFLMWDFAGYTGQIAVRMGKWKAVQQGLVKNPDAPIELYDLSKDIGEANDVAKDNPNVVKRIQRIIDKERTIPELEKFRFGKYAGGN